MRPNNSTVATAIELLFISVTKPCIWGWKINNTGIAESVENTAINNIPLLITIGFMMRHDCLVIITALME